MRRLGTVLLTMAFGIVLAITMLEIGLRVFFPQVYPTEPIHEVLFITPDQQVGWTHPANFDFFWNGRSPFCIEFHVDVSMNQYGYRGEDWTIEKPANTVRIAFIGDSFIEALQVTDEQTAVELLEKQLAPLFPGQTVEVMNFGVSNYGVGQYLMVYETDVRQFKPDYVLMFSAYMHFSRTVQRDLTSDLEDFYKLNIRPSYEIDDQGELVYLPAADYETYVEDVDKLIATRYGEDRSEEIFPNPSPLYSVNLLSKLFLYVNRRPGVNQRDPNQVFPDVELNYRIIEELNRQVQADGAMLVFVDVFDYLERYGNIPGNGVLVERNRELMESIGGGHVDLSPALRAAKHNPQFECDNHFNTTGNQATADAITEWFKAHQAF